LIGYTGGKKDNPKNHKPYDHSEALLIEFNPDIVSYRRLLEIWYELHDPWEVEQQRRYRSAVFWKSLTQQDTALQFLEEKRINNSSKQIYTEVERVHKFYEVEQFYDHDRQMQRAELPHPSM
jgi:peptide methionine sulfoxide reductase MsrA